MSDKGTHTLDSALIEELARAMWNTPNAIDAAHPEMTFGSGVVFAQAILPIIHRERIAAGERVRDAATSLTCCCPDCVSTINIPAIVGGTDE